MPQVTARTVLCIILLLMICVLVYAPSLNAPFLFDDNHMIVKNAFIKHPSHFPRLFSGFVTSATIPKGMCRPLLMLTFAFNYATSKLNPIGYHIINILLHFVNAALLLVLLLRLTGTERKKHVSAAALLTTLLFIVHPVNTEAVSYISSRSDVLVTAFILGGFLLYVKRRFGLSALCYIGALLTKETGLCFMIFIALYEYIYAKNHAALIKNWHKDKKVYFLIIGAVITLAYIAYHAVYFTPAFPMRVLRSYFSNVLIQSRVTFFYLRLFVVPLGLNLLHYFPEPFTIFQPEAIISLAGVCMLLIFFLYSRKRLPLIGLGLGWFLVGLFPKFCARLHYVTAEHHFYLPSIGLYIMVALLLKHMLSKNKKRTTLVFFLIASLFFTLTAMRNYEYADALRLYRIAVKRNPHAGTLRNLLGSEYLKRERTEKAKRVFTSAIGVAQKRESLLNAKIALARIYIEEDNLARAKTLLDECFRIKKIRGLGLYETLGFFYLKQNNIPLATKAFTDELKRNPASSTSLISLGRIYLEKGELTEAKQFFLTALQRDPDNYIGYYGLANTLAKEGDIHRAILLYRKSILLEASFAAAHYYLGALYAKTGDGRAIAELKKAVALKPDMAEAHNDLAVAYASLEPPQWELARKHCETAQALGYSPDRAFLELIEKNISHEND